MHTKAHGCRCTGQDLTETDLWGGEGGGVGGGTIITWSEVGKQNIQAKKVYFSTVH